MIETESMTEVQIKARLFDLQHHVCNGSVTIGEDPFSEGNRGCTGCSEVIQLFAELRRRNETIRPLKQTEKANKETCDDLWQ